jgi:hypothetical protein
MLLKLGLSDEQIVDYLYRAAFSRPPKDSERSALVEALGSAEQQRTAGSDDSRRSALVDMAWAMLTSQEFMFNH